MATGSGMPALLNLKRSSQSGTKTMTAAWQVVYAESCSQPYLFAGAIIDLTNMQAGDTINIRIEKVIVSGGSWVLHDYMAYADAQPATHPAVIISGIPDVYGVRVSIQQTAGVLRNIDCEFNDAKRLGL